MRFLCSGESLASYYINSNNLMSIYCIYCLLGVSGILIYDILSFKNSLLNIFINPTAILPVFVYSDYAIYLLI